MKASDYSLDFLTDRDKLGLVDMELTAAGIPEQEMIGGDLFDIPTHKRVKMLAEKRDEAWDEGYNNAEDRYEKEVERLKKAIRDIT